MKIPVVPEFLAGPDLLGLGEDWRVNVVVRSQRVCRLALWLNVDRLHRDVRPWVVPADGRGLHCGDRRASISREEGVRRWVAQRFWAFRRDSGNGHDSRVLFDERYLRPLHINSHFFILVS